MSSPDVAVAVAYDPGTEVPGVVTGLAVGTPVVRQPSGPHADVQETASSSNVVATSYLYSDLSAKFFARFDLDSNNSIDKAELRKALDSLGLTDVDVGACFAGFGTDRGVITLQDWEQGLDATPGLREAILAKLDAEAPPAS